MNIITNFPDFSQNDSNIINKSINTYGEEFMEDKCQEELMELIDAIDNYNENISKDCKRNKELKDGIIDEVTDSLIVILTLCKIKNISYNEIKNRIEYKVDRMDRRLKRSDWEIKNSNQLKEMCKCKSIDELIRFVTSEFDLNDFETNIHYFTKELYNVLNKRLCNQVNDCDDNNSNNEGFLEDLISIKSISSLKEIVNFKSKDKIIDKDDDTIIKYLKYYNL